MVYTTAEGKIVTYAQHWALNDVPRIIHWLWKGRQGQDNSIRYKRIRGLIRLHRVVKKEVEHVEAIGS